LSGQEKKSILIRRKQIQQHIKINFDIKKERKKEIKIRPSPHNLFIFKIAFISHKRSYMLQLNSF